MRLDVFLVFFILFLIISINPSSAVLIKESQEHFPIKNVEQKNLILDNNEDLNEREAYTYSLKEDSVYIKEMASEYDWKFWKWSKSLQIFLKYYLTCVLMLRILKNL